jgi:hypothetical protein
MSPLKRTRLLSLAALATVALAGCGDDDESAPSQGSATTATSATAAEEPKETDEGASGEGSDAAGERPGGGSSTDDPGAIDPSPPAGESPDGGGAGGACEYSAPPGRLGSRTVSIRLSGTSCEVGRRLAKAAALGQPAGANIPVAGEGFSCEPSTRERGVNVVYSCSKGSQRASFEIEWTAG